MLIKNKIEINIYNQYYKYSDAKLIIYSNARNIYIYMHTLIYANINIPLCITLVDNHSQKYCNCLNNRC